LSEPRLDYLHTEEEDDEALLTVPSEWWGKVWNIGAMVVCCSFVLLVHREEEN
jgi:hypothetical protein